MGEHYLSIRLQNWCQGKWLESWDDFPALFSVLDDGKPLNEPRRKFWHGPGPSYQNIDLTHARIEKDHGLIPYEAALVAHAREWPPVKHAFGQDVPRCPGWIAPNGDFYPCRSYDHISLAEHISLIQWGKSKTKLESYGWLCIRSEMFGIPDRITERQRTTLWAVCSSEYRIKPEYPEWQLSDDDFVIREVKQLIEEGKYE